MSHHHPLDSLSGNSPEEHLDTRKSLETLKSGLLPSTVASLDELGQSSEVFKRTGELIAKDIKEFVRRSYNEHDRERIRNNRGRAWTSEELDRFGESMFQYAWRNGWYSQNEAGGYLHFYLPFYVPENEKDVPYGVTSGIWVAVRYWKTSGLSGDGLMASVFHPFGAIDKSENEEKTTIWSTSGSGKDRAEWVLRRGVDDGRYGIKEAAGNMKKLFP